MTSMMIMIAISIFIVMLIMIILIIIFISISIISIVPHLPCIPNSTDACMSAMRQCPSVSVGSVLLRSPLLSRVTAGSGSPPASQFPAVLGPA